MRLCAVQRNRAGAYLGHDAAHHQAGLRWAGNLDEAGLFIR